MSDWARMTPRLFANILNIAWDEARRELHQPNFTGATIKVGRTQNKQETLVMSALREVEVPVTALLTFGFKTEDARDDGRVLSIQHAARKTGEIMQRKRHAAVRGHAVRFLNVKVLESAAGHALLELSFMSTLFPSEHRVGQVDLKEAILECLSLASATGAYATADIDTGAAGNYVITVTRFSKKHEVIDFSDMFSSVARKCLHANGWRMRSVDMYQGRVVIVTEPGVR